MEGIYFSNKIILMKSHDHIREVLIDLGIQPTADAVKTIRTAIKNDKKADKKLKGRKRGVRLISAHKGSGR